MAVNNITRLNNKFDNWNTYILKAQDTPYQITSLGDSALVISFGNLIDEQINKQVIACYDALKASALPGITDMSLAYSSLAVFYDTIYLYQLTPKESSVYDWMKSQVDTVIAYALDQEYRKDNNRLVQIPVWYDNAGLNQVAQEKKLSIESVQAKHTGIRYKVYMIGFLPGFAYLGKVDECIAMPRKAIPQPVSAGSVGIAGLQTGIYPVDSQGGWQIIGRTPLKMFDARSKELTRLKPGDSVTFLAIDEAEYHRIKNNEYR